MLDGTWNMRRVVWTKSKIAFARVGEEMMMDAIPLDQVRSVQIIVHEFDSSSAVLGIHCDAKRLESTENPIAACQRLDASQTAATKCIKIQTVPDGFNSGRPYFLRFPDEERCHHVALELNQLAVAERRRVEAKSRFKRHQASVHRVVHVQAIGPGPVQGEEARPCDRQLAFTAARLRAASDFWSNARGAPERGRCPRPPQPRTGAQAARAARTVNARATRPRSRA
jgi:hypothetical protein